MDPNATLAMLRVAAAQMQHEQTPEIRQTLAYALAEHVEALDERLSMGGFLPADWAR